MKEFKGTPGPWTIKHEKGHYSNTTLTAYIHATDPKRTIAIIYGDTPESMEANAKIFAASKQLLEALQAVVDHWQNSKGWEPENELINKVEAAISLALD